jgi:hypothetical protein
LKKIKIKKIWYLRIPLSHPLFIIKVYIIMNNMIIEDERNTDDASDIEYEQID